MSTLERAIEIAAIAHRGQTDKSGAPYILHPLRIMMRMTSEEAKIVAVLHDVVEDSPDHDKWTLERLRDAGFSALVVEGVDCVTNRPGESYDDFITRCSSNKIAREVKVGDLEDNMNLLRISDI